MAFYENEINQKLETLEVAYPWVISEITEKDILFGKEKIVRDGNLLFDTICLRTDCLHTDIIEGKLTYSLETQIDLINSEKVVASMKCPSRNFGDSLYIVLNKEGKLEIKIKY